MTTTEQASPAFTAVGYYPPQPRQTAQLPQDRGAVFGQLDGQTALSAEQRAAVGGTGVSGHRVYRQHMSIRQVELSAGHPQALPRTRSVSLESATDALAAHKAMLQRKNLVRSASKTPSHRGTYNEDLVSAKVIPELWSNCSLVVP